MTIREDIEKFNDDVKQHVQSMETNHEERKIDADENIIDAEAKKEMAREAKVVENEALGEDGFFKRMEDRIENAEIKHDEKVVDRKEENMEKEAERIQKHENEFYAEQDQIDQIDSEKAKK